MDVGTVNVTRLVVITDNAALRPALQKDYETRFAANVKKLLGP